MKQIKLSVVILNWNSLNYIEPCLQSVREAIPLGVETEIIIIDNGSTDGSVQHIKNRHTDVKLIENNRNKGVAPARNQGFIITEGKYILLLDIDTIVRNNAIEVLIQTMQSNDRIGLCGPRLVGTEAKLQFSCRNFPSVLSKVYRQFPDNLQNYLLKEEELRCWDHSSQREVGYVIGACQLIRKDALQKVGLLDSRMFYGVEEIDFCLRLWKNGWKVVYNPKSVVVHHEQRLSRKWGLSRLQIEHVKSLVLYFLKHRYVFKAPSIEALAISSTKTNKGRP